MATGFFNYIIIPGALIVNLDMPKRDTFYVTNGSPQSPVRIGSGHRSNTEVIMSHFEFLMPIDSMSGSTT